MQVFTTSRLARRSGAANSADGAEGARRGLYRTRSAPASLLASRDGRRAGSVGGGARQRPDTGARPGPCPPLPRRQHVLTRRSGPSPRPSCPLEIRSAIDPPRSRPDVARRSPAPRRVRAPVDPQIRSRRPFIGIPFAFFALPYDNVTSPIMYRLRPLAVRSRSVSYASFIFSFTVELLGSILVGRGMSRYSGHHCCKPRLYLDWNLPDFILCLWLLYRMQIDHKGL